MHILRYTIYAFIGLLGLTACSSNEKHLPADDVIPIVAEPIPSYGEGDDVFTMDGFKEEYENTNRLGWQRPNLIIGLLGEDDLSGKTVADIGSGTGFFAKRLTPLAEKVIALDIDENFLNFIDSTKVQDLSPDQQPRLETRLTPRDSPNLKENEVDAVLIVNTFMYIEDQLDYLQKLKPCLRDGGRLVIVDFKRKRTPLGPRPREHRAPLYIVEDYLHQAGYKNIQAIDTELRHQYILIAEV